MIECTCGTCNKLFNSIEMSDTPICYACALQSMTEGVRPPEESDINSALLISGEMSEEEWRQLQRELERVDHSRAQQDWEEENEYYRERYWLCSDED